MADILNGVFDHKSLLLYDLKKNIYLDSNTVHVTVKGVIKMEMPYYASKCFV